MGFLSKLFGRTEYDTTVADYVKSQESAGSRVAASASASAPGAPRAATGPFRMTVEDVFSITGRGLVATGRVESGLISVGESVMAQLPDGRQQEVTVTGIEKFRSVVSEAVAGDNVGLLFRGAPTEFFVRGTVLARD